MVNQMSNYQRLSHSLQTSHSTPNCLYEEGKDQGTGEDDDEISDDERQHFLHPSDSDTHTHPHHLQQQHPRHTPITSLNGHRMAIPPHVPGSCRGRKISSNVLHFGSRILHQTSIDSPPKSSRKNLYLQHQNHSSHYFHGMPPTSRYKTLEGEFLTLLRSVLPRKLFLSVFQKHSNAQFSLPFKLIYPDFVTLHHPSKPPTLPGGFVPENL